MLPQRKFREVVFQLLYSFDFYKDNEVETIFSLYSQTVLSLKEIYHAYERVEKINPHLPSIDAFIRDASRNYDIQRISKVEYTILRLGIFELFFDAGVPEKVAISEAIRLTRKFSTKEGGTFVNAILDAVYQKEKNAVLTPI